MKRGSPDLSGAESGTSGGGDEKDKNIARSHRVNESEEEELSDPESVETISTARISPRGAKNGGSNRKKTSRYYTDYLDRISRQERRRIEGEMIKGRKPGECTPVTQQ